MEQQNEGWCTRQKNNVQKCMWQNVRAKMATMTRRVRNNNKEGTQQQQRGYTTTTMRVHNNNNEGTQQQQATHRRADAMLQDAKLLRVLPNTLCPSTLLDMSLLGTICLLGMSLLLGMSFFGMMCFLGMSPPSGIGGHCSSPEAMRVAATCKSCSMLSTTVEVMRPTRARRGPGGTTEGVIDCSRVARDAVGRCKPTAVGVVGGEV